jgi:hypothetical protein
MHDILVDRLAGFAETFEPLKHTATTQTLIWQFSVMES